MEDVVEVCRRVTKSGGNGHIFFSALEFGQWFQMISKMIGKVGESPYDESEKLDGKYAKKQKRVKKTVFHLKTIPLQRFRSVWN